MSDHTLSSFSNQMADAVSAVSPSVIQVRGRRRPASGVVYATDVVLTTMRAIGREDGLQVRTSDGRTLDGESAGWDPATGLAVIRVAGLNAAPVVVATTPARVGHFALAVARSWSNAVTASAGIVSVIGGPHPHGPAVAEMIRTTAPMHEGFAGGAFVDASGRVLGITTASEIRGLGVVIPAAIAWATAATLVEHGRLKRGYLGLAGQSVRLAERQGGGENPGALLVVGMAPDSPATAAGLIVGDILLAFDGQAVHAPEDLLGLLTGDRVGRSVQVRVLRGGVAQEMTVVVGERP